MRYDKGTDFVEIEGVSDWPMHELAMLDVLPLPEAHPLLVGATKDARFIDRHGNEIDWRTNVMGLSVPQWNWWKRQMWAAARDEKLDPEV